MCIEMQLTKQLLCILLFQNSDHRIAKYLLSKGANPNHQDVAGNTPYIVASMLKSFKCLELMNKYGGDPLIENSRSDSVISILKKHTDPKTLKFLGKLEKDSKMKKIK